jgi:putative endonuclease
LHKFSNTKSTYYVYLLQCADDTLYTGITTDVVRRLLEHKSGKGGNYTRAHGAAQMVYVEAAADRSHASKREAEIKHLSREDKIALSRSEEHHRVL